MKKIQHALVILFSMMALAIMVSCAGEPTVETVEVTVETVREVEVTVEVEKIKEVEVEVEKEVEVVVTATPEMEESSESMSNTDKSLTVNVVFWPDSGMAIESDSGSVMTSWGMTEGLIRVNFEGQMEGV